MSFNAMLEIANTQNSIGSLADAIAITLDTKGLQANTEILSEKSVKIGVENATGQEAVALINTFLDTASVNIDLLVVEACDNCALVIFNDTDGAEVASLWQKKMIEVASSILDMGGTSVIDDDDDAQDQEDEPYIADPDEDVDPDEDDEDEEDENPNKMKIVSNEEMFKLATRLHALCCGNDKSEFPHFLTSLDKMLNGFRQSSGYEPPEVNEQASAEDPQFFADLADLMIEETAKKKKTKHKSGRAGFLSSYMKLLSKKGDQLGESHDALDVEGATHLLADVGSDYIQELVEERNARGLNSPNPDKVEEEVNKALEEAASAKRRVINA